MTWMVGFHYAVLTASASGTKPVASAKKTARSPMKLKRSSNAPFLHIEKCSKLLHLWLVHGPPIDDEVRDLAGGIAPSLPRPPRRLK